MLITFSGIDGAGKSTLIESLRCDLLERGLQVRLRSMYDHIGLYAYVRNLRDWIFGRVDEADMKYTNDPFLGRRPALEGVFSRCVKSVTGSWLIKRPVLLVDQLLFRLHLLVIGSGRSVLIMDRYFYDSIADTTASGDGLFARCLLRLAPRPDLPIFVDADPEEAFERKGEFSVAYLAQRRRKYERIFKSVEGRVVLRNEILAESTESVRAIVIERLADSA